MRKAEKMRRLMAQMANKKPAMESEARKHKPKQKEQESKAKKTLKRIVKKKK